MMAENNFSSELHLRTDFIPVSLALILDGNSEMGAYGAISNILSF